MVKWLPMITFILSSRYVGLTQWFAYNSSPCFLTHQVCFCLISATWQVQGTMSKITNIKTEVVTNRNYPLVWLWCALVWSRGRGGQCLDKHHTGTPRPSPALSSPNSNIKHCILISCVSVQLCLSLNCLGCVALPEHWAWLLTELLGQY